MNSKITQPFKLTKEHREAIAILSIGTFLEYFDLMLYVHMGIFISGLFFPKTDPYMTSLLKGFAFCSTYVLRPVGALLFGYIGDKFGRKIVIVITTMIMSISCIIIANLSTYEQIGITASIIMLICRAIQGLSSMGERVGATLYLTELLPKHQINAYVALIIVFTYAGGVGALAMSTLITSCSSNWRMAFWIGAIIALIGFTARTSLKETPDFLYAKKIDNQLDKNLTQGFIWKKAMAIKFKTFISYYLIESIYPLTFYFVFILCTNRLEFTFHYNSNQIMRHNFFLALIALLNVIVIAFLVRKVDPFKIMRTRFYISIPIYLAVPILYHYTNHIFYFTFMQVIFLLVSNTVFPAHPIFYRHFPILNRFHYITMGFGISQTVMYVFTSLSLPILIKYFSFYALYIVIIPLLIGFAFGLNHFHKLEAQLTEGKV